MPRITAAFALALLAGLAAPLTRAEPPVDPTLISGGQALPTPYVDAAHAQKAQRLIDRAIAYLRTKQDDATGGWSIPPADQKRPAFPAITGLVVNGMLLSPNLDAKDPTVARGLDYILSKQNPDGGIYDRVLPSYNTAITSSALARANTPEATAANAKALDYLRKLQYGESADGKAGGSEAAQPVDKSHPYYGGVGYGNRGRPDLSNLAFMLQALHDAGVPGDDPAFQRALVFLQRCQMSGAINDMPYAKGSQQGGFIYATAENKDTLGQGQSFAGTIEETLDSGETATRLRAYGSITYAGLKSYAYADLKREDPRVAEVMKWVRNNYTVDENPGMGTDGQYYYYLMFARALNAWGQRAIEAAPKAADAKGADANPVARNWAEDLIDKLATLQNEDGSFKPVDDRWMENDPVLITAYSLIALQNALGRG